MFSSSRLENLTWNILCHRDLYLFERGLVAEFYVGLCGHPCTFLLLFWPLLRFCPQLPSWLCWREQSATFSHTFHFYNHFCPNKDPKQLTMLFPFYFSPHNHSDVGEIKTEAVITLPQNPGFLLRIIES